MLGEGGIEEAECGGVGNEGKRSEEDGGMAPPGRMGRLGGGAGARGGGRGRVRKAGGGPGILGTLAYPECHVSSVHKKG